MSLATVLTLPAPGNCPAVARACHRAPQHTWSYTVNIHVHWLGSWWRWSWGGLASVMDLPWYVLSCFSICTLLVISKYRLYLDHDDKMKDFTVLVGCIFQLPVHLRLPSSFLLVYSHWILVKYVILTKQIIWPRNDNLIKSDSECNSILKTLFRIILLSIIFHISVTLVSRAVQ